MRILVVYHTLTGNTEQIARSIHEAAGRKHQPDLKKIEEIKPESCTGYDLVFVGCPIHAGGLSEPAQQFLRDLPSSAGYKLAGFVTHSSPGFSGKESEKGMATLAGVTREKGISYFGCFDCQGRLAPELHPYVKQRKGFSDSEFQAYIDEANKHPDEADRQSAADFALRVLSQA